MNVKLALQVAKQLSSYRKLGLFGYRSPAFRIASKTVCVNARERWFGMGDGRFSRAGRVMVAASLAVSLCPVAQVSAFAEGQEPGQADGAP